MNLKLTLEQKALTAYFLSNFGGGMVFVVALMPDFFVPKLGYYVILPFAVLLFIALAKLNYNGLKYGLVEGFKRKY